MKTLTFIFKAYAFAVRLLFAGIAFFIFYLSVFLLNIFFVSWVYASPCANDCVDVCKIDAVNDWSDSLPWGDRWVGLRKTVNSYVAYDSCTLTECPNCDEFSGYSCACTAYDEGCNNPQSATISYFACWESDSPMPPVVPPTPEQLVCGNYAPCPNCSHINQFTCNCDSVAPYCGHRDLIPETCSCGCLSTCNAPFVRDFGWCNCYCSQGMDYYIDLKDCQNHPTWNINGSDPYGYGRLDSSPGIMKFQAIIQTYPNWVWGLTSDPLVNCELHSMACAFYPEWNETDCDIDNGIVGYVNTSSFSMSGLPLGYYMFHCPSIPANCDYSSVTDDSNVFYWNPSALISCEAGCQGENCPPSGGKDGSGKGLSYFTNALKRGSKSVGHGGCEKRDNP